MSFLTRRREGAKIFSRRDAEGAEKLDARNARFQFSPRVGERLLAQPCTPSLRSLRLCAHQFPYFFAPSRLRVNQNQAAR
jgi:hypothetical protein